LEADFGDEADGEQDLSLDVGQLADGPDDLIDGYGVEFGFVENFVVLLRKGMSNRCVCKKTLRWICTSFLRKSSSKRDLIVVYHSRELKVRREGEHQDAPTLR
jgi:hypothetical protein